MATLTYRPEELPKNGSLSIRDYQLFLKNLRERVRDTHGEIRFYAVGEYGEQSFRPHYHIALFGVGLEDTDVITKTWKKGFVQVDELNHGTAGYMLGYVSKKMTKKTDPRLLRENGEYLWPEFARMSLKPGIGALAVPVIADSISLHSTEIPWRIRMDGSPSGFGRYIHGKIAQRIGDPDAIKQYEKEVWLQKVFEQAELERAEASSTGKSVHELRKEVKKQRFLNLLSKARLKKRRRTL